MSGTDSVPSPGDLSRWLALKPEELLRQCAQSPYQGPGPGGQKRNRVYSGVRLTHGPSGLTAESSESREARRNLELALHRLRLAMALSASLPVPPTPPTPPTPLGWEEARRSSAEGFRVACNPAHADYPRFAFAALLALDAHAGRLSESAADLGCSASALTRFLLAEKSVWARTQIVRKRHGLHPLKSG